MTTLKRSSGASGAAWAVLVGGGIAGAIDITVAATMTAMGGGQPMRMLQGIAFALIGKEAFQGGWATAALGLACHFAIALGAALAYFLVSRIWSVLVREPVVCGLLYGVVVSGITNFVIVPFSRIGRPLPGSPGQVFFGLLVLMIGVGLPIALATRWFSR